MLPTWRASFNTPAQFIISNKEENKFNCNLRLPSLTWMKCLHFDNVLDRPEKGKYFFKVCSNKKLSGLKKFFSLSASFPFNL